MDVSGGTGHTINFKMLSSLYIESKNDSNDSQTIIFPFKKLKGLLLDRRK